LTSWKVEGEQIGFIYVHGKKILRLVTFEVLWFLYVMNKLGRIAKLLEIFRMAEYFTTKNADESVGCISNYLRTIKFSDLRLFLEKSTHSY